MKPFHLVFDRPRSTETVTFRFSTEAEAKNFLATCGFADRLIDFLNWK